MKNINKHYVGIDFGTSNSYFCITSGDVLQPNSICFDNETSIETAVLWENDAVKDFGTRAVKGWGYAPPAEKENWRLNVQFKPDISTSNQAKQSAVAFLKCAAQDMKDRSILPRGNALQKFHVIIGIPAKMLAGHKSAMNEIMNSAGFNDFKLVEEPVGALLHHIIRHDIQIEDVGKGILIIDFGGGTCDVAFMLRLDVKEKFGDPILGGRLFDDLFYQWFIDQNPDVENKLENSGDSYYIHWVKCREMKEAFSNTMRRNRSESFRFNIPHYGFLDNAAWDEFLRRAENYKPSKSFLGEIKNFGKAYEKLTSGKSINLLERFHNAVKSIINEGKIKIENVEQIILTGGSSSWPFVREMVSEIFILEKEKILASANPRAAIGEGLALLPVIQDRFNKIKSRLQIEKEEKITEIINSVMADIYNFCNCISDDIVQKVFAEAVDPAIDSYCQTGGTTEQLNSHIKTKIEDLKPEFEKVIEVQKPEIEAEISQRISGILNDWFLSHNIKWRKIDIGLASVDNPNVSLGNVKVPVELDAIVASIVGLVTASLLGGGGIALLMSGPVGWFIGLGIGTAGTYFGMKKLTSKIPFPKMIMKNKLTRKMIDISLKRAKSKSKKKMLNYLLGHFNENQEEIEEQIADFIENQIKDLDAINSI